VEWEEAWRADLDRLAQDGGDELLEVLLAVEASASTRLHVLDAPAVAPAAGIGVAGVLYQEGSLARKGREHAPMVPRHRLGVFKRPSDFHQTRPEKPWREPGPEL
jgi:hypothetical protein